MKIPTDEDLFPVKERKSCNICVYYAGCGECDYHRNTIPGGEKNRQVHSCGQFYQMDFKTVVKFSKKVVDILKDVETESEFQERMQRPSDYD